jgi:hypothetical protein
MPFHRILALLSAVLAASGLTVAVGVALAGGVSPQGAAALGLAALLIAVLWRLVAGRLR